MEAKASVATPSPRIAELEEKKELVRTIMGGTAAMRAAGQKFLPKHPAEDANVYKVRLQKTFLDNFVSKAIESATGKIFSKEVQTKDLLPEIETLIEDIDRQGRALSPFIMSVADQAFEDGVSFVLVDMPKIEGVQTQADEKALGARPYAIHIKPCVVLETLGGMIDGVETLTRLRIKECIPEPNGWGYTDTEQIRVWYNENGVVRWETYRQDEKATVKGEWFLHEEGTTTFKRIYLIPFYTNRCGYMEGEPPFQEIAEQNLEHWQWKSEHAHALSMCCFGMYTATGVPVDFQFTVGPARALKSTNPDAKFGVLETTGKGVELAEKAIEKIESRIESAGVNLRVENAGKVTATAASLDSEETNSALKAIAGGFSDSIELLFMAFAEIIGLDASKAGEAEVFDGFGVKTGTDAGLQELGKSRALGDISRPMMLKEYQRRGELAEDFDIDKNEEELSQETPALSSFGTNNQNTNQGTGNTGTGDTGKA
jgi:hypothetical protein